MAESQTVNGATDASKLKNIQRSAAYPAFRISASIDLVKRIYSELGISGYHSRETIGKVLRIAPATIQIPISTAGQYGLLDMKSKVGYKPTPLFVRLYKPENDQERRAAMIECLRGPKLYQGLLQEFTGHVVPSAVGLSTILFRRYNIAENAADRAAQVFIENLKDLDLLTEENVLRSLEPSDEVPPVPPVPHEDEAIDVEDTDQKQLAQSFVIGKPNGKPSAEQVSIMPEQEEFPIFIPLKGGKRARLYIPENITNEDLDKITRFIEALRE